MLLFLSNQEAGCGVCRIPWDPVVNVRYTTRVGEEVKVKIPDLPLQARTPKPSYPGEPEMSRMHVNSGESGVEILKLKCMRLRPSHFSCGVTGERSRRGQGHGDGAAVPAWSVDGWDDCSAEKILGILSTQDSYCTCIFCIKVCMVSNKGFKPKFVVKWPGSV